MSGFGELAKRLELLREKPSEIAEAVRSRLEELIREEFAQGKDPYGRPWKPLKTGGQSRLQETGAMLASLKVEVRETTVEITFSDYKFAFHQGTRPILTVGVMPATWSQAIEEAFAKAMKK